MTATEPANGQTLVRRLQTVLADQGRVRDDVRQYFNPREGDDGYTGRALTTLFGGGDRPAVAYLITADDLLGAAMLDAQTPPAVALRLLEGELGREVSARLRDLPLRASMFDPRSDELLADGGPADRARQLLDDATGNGSAIAGPLLARKRPALIPAGGDVVSCALGSPERLWPSLHRALSEDADEWEALLSGIRSEAGVSERIPPLRILDVAIWMRHVADHRPTDCPSIA
jgi:hypothetical protein